MLSILIEIFPRVHAKEEKILNDFRFGTLIGRYPTDGAASMALKGLNVTLHPQSPFPLSGCHTATTNQGRLQSSTTPPKRTLWGMS